MGSVVRRKPHNIDVSVANSARVSDYLMGGAHNFAADREAGEAIFREVPDLRQAAFDSREFLRRVIRFMLDQGIRQFLDLGAGLPTLGSVHQIAQAAAPESRVVYVDRDPVVVAHSRTMIRGVAGVEYVQADIVDIDAVFESAEVRNLIDLSEPVGLVMVGVMHEIADARRPRECVYRYGQRLASGSYLAGTHLTADRRPREIRALLDLVRGKRLVTIRNRAQIEALSPGFVLEEPGVVLLPEWRPDSPDAPPAAPSQSLVYAAVARKP